MHLSKERVFSEERTKFYGAEIILALGYLHEHNIIYRDIKVSKCLLSRIRDFIYPGSSLGLYVVSL